MFYAPGQNVQNVHYGVTSVSSNVHSVSSANIHILIRDSDRSRSRDRRRPREEEGGYGDSLLGKNLMEAVMKREREVSGALACGEKEGEIRVLETCTACPYACSSVISVPQAVAAVGKDYAQRPASYKGSLSLQMDRFTHRKKSR
jgi:hypothetical protein